MNEADHLMITSGRAHLSPRPAHPDLAGKVAVAVVAIPLIGTLVGRMLGLFPMHSEDAAFSVCDSTPRG